MTLQTVKFQFVELNYSISMYYFQLSAIPDGIFLFFTMFSHTYFNSQEEYEKSKGE